MMIFNIYQHRGGGRVWHRRRRLAEQRRHQRRPRRLHRRVAHYSVLFKMCSQPLARRLHGVAHFNDFI